VIVRQVNIFELFGLTSQKGNKERERWYC